MARQAYSVPRKKLFEVFVLIVASTCLVVGAEQAWDHVVDLDANYQLAWTVREPDIVFEVRVRTHGYIGFGFSRDGTIYGADVFIGWIDNGHTFFHVSCTRFGINDDDDEDDDRCSGTCEANIKNASGLRA
jgi:DOMON domain